MLCIFLLIFGDICFHKCWDHLIPGHALVSFGLVSVCADGSLSSGLSSDHLIVDFSLASETSIPSLQCYYILTILFQQLVSFENNLATNGDMLETNDASCALYETASKLMIFLGLCIGRIYICVFFW